MDRVSLNFTTADQFCSKVTDGTHDSPKAVDSGKPLITSKHIKGREIDFETAYNICIEDYDAINKRSQVYQWDVVISMIGEYCGYCYVERSKDINYAIKNVGVFRAGNQVNAEWLYYYLNSPIGKSYLKKIRGGSSQPYLSLGGLRSLPVLIPESSKEKESIVSVLSTLDSKIELNNRINTELEGMAKLLYDYWFVQFDFPMTKGQAKALGNPALEGKPYKSSGGKMVFNKTLKREIPEGWIESSIGNSFETHLGGTPSRKKDEYWFPEEVNWLSSGEKENMFILQADEHISDEGLQKSAATLLPAGTVILSIVRHIRASILGVDAATNQSVVGIQETDTLKSCFIYPYLLREIPRLMTLRTGAQQPHINKKILGESILIVPDDTTVENYTTSASPLFEKIKNNLLQNQQLTELRDWLLPMLMNGQVTIR